MTTAYTAAHWASSWTSTRYALAVARGGTEAVAAMSSTVEGRTARTPTVFGVCPGQRMRVSRPTSSRTSIPQPSGPQVAPCVEGREEGHGERRPHPGGIGRRRAVWTDSPDDRRRQLALAGQPVTQQRLLQGPFVERGEHGARGHAARTAAEGHGLGAPVTDRRPHRTPPRSRFSGTHLPPAARPYTRPGFLPVHGGQSSRRSHDGVAGKVKDPSVCDVPAASQARPLRRRTQILGRHGLRGLGGEIGHDAYPPAGQDEPGVVVVRRNGERVEPVVGEVGVPPPFGDERGVPVQHPLVLRPADLGPVEHAAVPGRRVLRVRHVVAGPAVRGELRPPAVPHRLGELRAPRTR